MKAHMFVSVTEQGGRYFSTGEQGQPMCDSNENPAAFGADLNRVLKNILFRNRNGDQVEVYFCEGEEKVRFILENAEQQIVNVHMVSAIPPKGSNAEIFLSQFVEEIKE